MDVSQINPSVNSARSQSIAKDDKINGLIPAENNTIFVFPSLCHDSYIWRWIFNVGNPSAKSSLQQLPLKSWIRPGLPVVLSSNWARPLWAPSRGTGASKLSCANKEKSVLPVREQTTAWLPVVGFYVYLMESLMDLGVRLHTGQEAVPVKINMKAGEAGAGPVILLKTIRFSCNLVLWGNGLLGNECVNWEWESWSLVMSGNAWGTSDQEKSH